MHVYSSHFEFNVATTPTCESLVQYWTLVSHWCRHAAFCNLLTFLWSWFAVDFEIEQPVHLSTYWLWGWAIICDLAPLMSCLNWSIILILEALSSPTIAAICTSTQHTTESKTASRHNGAMVQMIRWYSGWTHSALESIAYHLPR